MIRNPFIIVSCLFIFILANNYAVAQNELEIGGIINSYAKVTSFDVCKKTITVLNATGFKSGDKALIIQMQGAIADETQSTTFGTIKDYNKAGNFEFVKIKSIRNTEIEFESVTVNDYDVSGNVQLVTVPFYNRTVYPDGTLTAKAWDGTLGGILVLETTAALDLRDGGIDVSGKGFRGGVRSTGSIYLGGVATYYNSAAAADSGGSKGEGIVRFIMNKENGRGALGNGGGGGNGHNAGGGGGGNGGVGGNGGREFIGPDNNPMSNGGIGGLVPEWKNDTSKLVRLFMGGGGGAGQMNNGVGTVGGNGGGIIIIRAKNIIGRNRIIKCNGVSQTGIAENDGAGGGGAGGSVFLDFDFGGIKSAFTIEANGGDGGNGGGGNTTIEHGTGGGGGGGMVFIVDIAEQNNIHVQAAGGKNGVMVGNGSNTFATSGHNGQEIFGFRIPQSTNPVLSVMGSGDRIICRGSSIRLGNEAAGGRPPYTYQWSPGSTLDDPKSAMPIATPTEPTRYTVIVTDAAGCTDTKSMSINLFSPPDLEIDSSLLLCRGSSIQLNAIGAGKYQWTPTDDIIYPDSNAPIVSPTVSRTYYVKITDVNGCSKTDSIYIEIVEKPTFSLTDSVFFCMGKSVELAMASEAGNAPFLYEWSSTEPIMKPNDRVQQFFPQTSARYYVTVTDKNGCTTTDSVEVIMFGEAQANAGSDRTICIGDSALLSAQGGAKYEWTPDEDISSTTIPNPTVYPRVSRTYYLKVENADGCIAYDTVEVKVNALPQKPIITRKNDTLYAENINNGDLVEWKRDGVVIKGDSSVFVADSTGDYTVIITDINGCSTESDIVPFTIGAARFCANPISGAVGENISIPIFLCNASLLNEAEADSIEATILFNKTTLLPLGNYRENTIIGNRRLLRITGAIPSNEFTPFATLNATALLGTDTLTRIDIGNGISYGGKIVLENGSVVFNTSGICIEGGVRLWRDGEITDIQNIYSDSRKTTVNYTIASPEPHNIAVYNSLGTSIVSFPIKTDEGGLHLFEFDNSTLPIGMYYVVVITPTEHSKKPFLLIR